MTTITINSMGFVKGSDMAVYLRSGAKQSTLGLLTLQVVNIQYLLEFVRLCLYLSVFLCLPIWTGPQTVCIVNIAPVC